MARKTFSHFAGTMILAGVWIYLFLQVANWLCNGRLW
jgi:hypothetical protein